MWLRHTLINFSNRPILWTTLWCITSKDCISSAWVNRRNICRREQTCIAPMHCHSSASMPKWLPQAVTRKRNSSKGNSFFCFILRKSQDHNHPHFYLVCSPSVMLKKKMPIPPFSFLASHDGYPCSRSVDDRQVSQSGKPHLQRNSGGAVSKLARECYSLWTYGKSFTLCTLEHADRMNGIAGHPPEVLPSHPSNLLGTLSLHPTKDLRGLLDYWRTQI